MKCILFGLLVLNSGFANAGNWNCTPEKDSLWTKVSFVQLEGASQLSFHFAAWGMYLGADMLCELSGVCVGFANGTEIRGRVNLSKTQTFSPATIKINGDKKGIPAGTFVCEFNP